MLKRNSIIEWFNQVFIDLGEWICYFTSFDYILFVEYNLTPSGRLVGRLPIWMNGWTPSRTMLLCFAFSYEYAQGLVLELPRFLYVWSLVLGLWLGCGLRFFILCLDEICYSLCWDFRLYFVMYYDTCDMATLESVVCVDVMLWNFSDVSFKKLCMHDLEYVASKLLE